MANFPLSTPMSLRRFGSEPSSALKTFILPLIMVLSYRIKKFKNDDSVIGEVLNDTLKEIDPKLSLILGALRWAKAI